MTPQIHFDYTEPRNWIGKTFVQIKNEMENLRIAIKNASGYFWDSQNFFIDDISGKPALRVQFWPDNISLWNATNGRGIQTIQSDENGIFTEDDYNKLYTCVVKVANGFTQCASCNDWVKEYKPYSFAGAVCLTCFDPERHKGPDTRGD
jgi:hypothetical protein